MSIEEIVELVTREVIKELLRQGVKVDKSFAVKPGSAFREEVLEVDMSGYKTPILAESSFHKIAPETKELIVPERTVITPGARDIIKRNQIRISYKSNRK
jgi:ribosomal protein L20A (L18A)